MFIITEPSAREVCALLFVFVCVCRAPFRRIRFLRFALSFLPLRLGLLALLGGVFLFCFSPISCSGKAVCCLCRCCRSVSIVDSSMCQRKWGSMHAAGIQHTGFIGPYRIVRIILVPDWSSVSPGQQFF